jgi:aminopeptidase N
MTSYRFSRKDFGPLEFAPLHYDLLFDIRSDRVRVVGKQTYRYNGEEPTTTIELNCHDLVLESVELFQKHSILGPPPVGIDAVVPDFIAHVASLTEPMPAEYTYDQETRKLIVTIPSTKKGEEIAIRTISKCVPTANILEGIYFDSTPEGAPQTMITQCQQYGFQRIVPCVDRMASKTFYTSTFVASTKYSNVVSNGDLAPEFINLEDGSPAFSTVAAVLSDPERTFLNDTAHNTTKDDDGDDENARTVLRYYNHKVNMAPYLFFMGVGSYDVYKRQVEYPDGGTFMLELLCIPGVVEAKHAKASLSALHDSILWLYLEGGPEKYDHINERKSIYELMDRREELKKLQNNNSLVQSMKWNATTAGETKTSIIAVPPFTEAHDAELVIVRNELKRLSSVWKETGYRYTGSVYREIAMENSNYGGMENVGNTTIISSRLTPSSWLVDGGYLYMEGVKIHEYYHNINGSQVTGQSPFEIWLNEAVTVHVQREREDALFGAGYMRLRKIIYAFQPATGPLAQDRSPTSMAVEPIGFNTTHELISAMTYSKAPEFVRMIQLILGKKTFVRALENYHQRFAYSNATTNDWIACMAEFAPTDVDLMKMATGWLRRTGYPTVTVEDMSYDAAKNECHVKLTQSGFEDQKDEANKYPWIVC